MMEKINKVSVESRIMVSQRYAHPSPQNLWYARLYDNREIKAANTVAVTKQLTFVFHARFVFFFILNIWYS